MCDSLIPHRQQHSRLPCLSLSLRVGGICSNSCPLSQWYHPAISSRHPLLFLPSIFPRIRVFSNESAPHIRWPKYWNFSFSISPSSEYSGLISFRMDWFDFLTVQATLKSLIQYQFKSINSSVFSLPYGPTLTSTHDYWKNPSSDYMDCITLLPKWCIYFLIHSLGLLQLFFQGASVFYLLISWLQSPSAVNLEPKKIQSVTVSIVFPIYLPWSDGIRCHDLSFLNAEFQASFFTLLFHLHQGTLFCSSLLLP